jgi:protein-S-isoprenylcysteine O-methyltransferase Ste14
MLLLKLLSVPAYLLPGLDHRFDWSREFLAPVPWWLTMLALLLVLAGHFLFFWVMKANRFAASIILVESGQTVADAGPYRLVRHPMYAGAVVLWLAAPVALGSFIALPAFAPVLPLIVFRLLNEERFHSARRVKRPWNPNSRIRIFCRLHSDHATIDARQGRR